VMILLSSADYVTTTVVVVFVVLYSSCEVFCVCFPLSGSVIGEALSSHPLVRKVGFTGSTPVGKTIMQRSIEFNNINKHSAIFLVLIIAVIIACVCLTYS